MVPTEHYPSQPLNHVNKKPVAKAKFKEPVFKFGKFQDCYIEVELTVYPVSITDPTTKKMLVGVRFGEMNVLRFVEHDRLYEMEKLDI